MSSQDATLNHAGIVVGQPLPFSVYSADRKLLLAKGEVVESDRIRDSLLRAGRYQSNGVALMLSASNSVAASGGIAQESSEPEIVEESPLHQYLREYQSAGGSARVGIRLSREENGENFACWILGADEQHGLIVSAPATNDRSFVAVTEGQTWIFRTMYLTAAVKFLGTIRKVNFEPVPSLNVSLPKQIELRHVRSSPRVSTCVRGSIEIGKEIPVLVIDISTGGLRVAMERSHGDLKPGLRLMVNFGLNMLGRDYSFKVPATVINKRSEFEKRYPELWIFGLKIEAQSELEKLVLHSYVYEHMMMEFNPFWRLLVQN